MRQRVSADLVSSIPLNTSVRRIAVAPMYYVWESRRKSPREALIPKFAPVGLLYKVSFIAARRIEKELPELELHMDRGSQGLLTDDLVIRKRRGLVHSQKLIDALRRAGVDNIDYYPCRIVNDVTGEVFQTHQAANILDVIYCLDWESSELEIDDEEPNEIWYINNLKLIEERLGDAPMFRLGERRSIIVVHETVKKAVEAAGATGVVFLPASGYRDYMGYGRNNPRNIMGTHDTDPDGAIDAVDEDEDEGGLEGDHEAGLGGDVP